MKKALENYNGEIINIHLMNLGKKFKKVNLEVINKNNTT
jgi:hypothetical protein